MKNKLILAITLGLLAQFVYASALDECLTNCTLAYKQCMEDRNAIEQCQLAQKNCEEECRKH